MLTLSSPIHYVLELTPHCNNHCIGCGNAFSDNSIPVLSSGQWQSLLNKISSDAVNLRISGGEPTLYPEFETIIKLIADMPVSITLFTNARWQSPERVIDLFKNISQNKGLLISLHSCQPDIHDSFTRVKGSFAETVQNIRRAIDAGLNVATSTIITKANYFQVNEIIAFTSELCVDRAFFARYIPVKNDEITPADDELKQAIDIIENHRKNGARAEFSVCIPQCFALSSSQGCLSGVTYCVIDPWGNVRPCTHTPVICGSLLEHSIEDIWHGEKMQQWREMIHPQCKNCVELSKCHGGCRAAAGLAGLEKDPLMREPILQGAGRDYMNQELELYEKAYPVGNFRIRYEYFGYVLICDNRVMPVSHHAKPILDALNGNFTLRGIQEHFGQEALNFVGSLYQKGFVEMREDIQ